MDQLSRTLVVGDIHGCYTLLVKALKQANYQPGLDRLIFLGDYIDRGYESAKVVKLVKELVTEGAIALMGNHEQMLLDTIRNWEEKRDYWFLNGGKQTLLSYGVELSKVREEEAVKQAVPREHLDFFQSLPLYLEDDEYIYCHAGIRPGVPLEKQTRDDLLWIRESFLTSPYQGKTIIFGHTPTMLIDGHGIAEVYRRENKIGIDTGAYFSGMLTVLQLSSNTYHRKSA
jgi:serine/threonine protein phosphatase 1